MIIGLTGTNASGKGEVAEYLKKKGFSYFSLSDEIRLLAKEKGLELTRENLRNLGNEMRQKHSAGYWAGLVNKKLEGNCIVDSIRNPAEVEELRKNKGFVFIAVDAPQKTRYERMKKRGRIGEDQSFEDFLKQENEENSNNPSNLQLNKTMEMADKKIMNKGNLEELHEKVESILKSPLFIVLEGIDGSGKGEMIKRLEVFLKEKGHDVIVTREPTDSQYGKQIRKILAEEKDPKANAQKCFELYVKDREEHVKEIEKWLEQGNIVICDRYYYSTIAYQNAQGIDVEELIAANIEFRTPDLTLILDLPPEVSLERISKARAIEKFEKIEFMKTLRQNFLDLKNKLDDNIKIIDASKTKEEVFEQIKKEI